MASAPQANRPLFFNDLMPLNSRDHADWKGKPADSAFWLAEQHAVPLTVDEFAQAQRHYPIVFSQGDNPVPLALMGLNEGVNTFVDKKGKFHDDNVYVPAYARRYPFMLARLNKDSEDMSLCFDPSSGLVGADVKKGQDLFDKEGKPTQYVQAVMQFCERFEQAGFRSSQAMDEIKKHDLLMDGEVAIQPANKDEKPFVYRGFRMIDQDKFRDLDDKIVLEWHKNGLLSIIHSHIYSLELMRVLFGKQVKQGTAPEPVPANEGPSPVEVQST